MGALRRNRLSAALITHLPNVRYLCGFTGSAAVLGATRVGARAPHLALFTDGRYTEQAKAEAQGVEVVICSSALLSTALEWLLHHRAARIGMEAEHLSVAAWNRVALEVPKTNKVSLLPTSGLVESLRLIKEAEEVEQIRAAIHLASSLFEPVIKKLEPGIAETELAADLEYQARLAGAEGMSFSTIVAAGPRSALPHGRASSQAVPNRGFVIFDFGVILAGYCSDMTRTVHVGRPSAECRRMYRAVLAAQEAAIQAVRPGVEAGQVDQVARRVLEKAGFGRFFTHSTGHGVGLEIHEPPRLGKNQTDKLEPGMVITIEPGIYIPGKGGVRIEDVVVVTRTGCEVLTPTPKALIAL